MNDLVFFEFPNMKENFIPDPGFTMFEIDLAGADARIVAWKAGNEGQKNAFKSGMKIHTYNGASVWGRERMGPNGKAEPYYTRIKKGVHATHYGAKDAAERCGMTQDEWREFQTSYFRANPANKRWMEAVDLQLQTTKKITNPWGWDITYYDRPENCYTEALAWEPSSMVALVTYEAMDRLEVNPNIILQLQVHDSLLGQIPTKHLRETIPWMYEQLHTIVIPYDEPLIIPWELKLSDKSWGHMSEVKWDDFYQSEAVQELAHSV